jgi:putative tricarboxylic transport membrane protein
LVAPYVEEALPNDVGVQPENRPGAGGVTPTTEVYNADPDGYTLMIFNVQSFVRSQIRGQGNYQSEEMTPIAQIAQNIRAIGVAENSGIETWDDFVQGVQNEDLTFGATGATSGGVMIPAVVGDLGGLYPAENVIENRIDFDGKGEHATSMERGDVDVMAGSYSSVLPYVEDGPVEMLTVTTTDEEPPEATPDANTFADLDIDNPGNIENTITSFRVFVGPPEIPDERATILQDAFEQAITNDEFQADAEEVDRPVVYGDAETVEEAIATSQEQWNELSDLLET